jgi:hypothetical protein
VIPKSAPSSLAIGARWRKMAERQQAIEDFLHERGNRNDNR